MFWYEITENLCKKCKKTSMLKLQSRLEQVVDQLANCKTLWAFEKGFSGWFFAKNGFLKA